MSDPIAMHSDLTPLGFLVGTWSGAGRGAYPTIEDFAYRETVTYAHVGKPFLVYTQRTQDAVTGAPLHAETGYLRPIGAAHVELVLSQPSGIVEIHEGTVSGTTIELVSTLVVGTPTAKPVTAVRRSVAVEGTVMRSTLDMAAMGLELQFHLAAELARA